MTDLLPLLIGKVIPATFQSLHMCSMCLGENPLFFFSVFPFSLISAPASHVGMHLPLSRGPLWLEELLWHSSNIHICRPKPHKRFYCVSSGLRSGKGSSGGYEEMGSGWVLGQPERRWGDRVAQCSHCSLKLYPKLSEQGKISESNQKPSGRKSCSLRCLPTSRSLP